MTNDLPAGLSLAAMAFNGSGYSVSGNSIVMTGHVTGGSAILTLSIDLQANNASVSNATVNGDIAIHASNVTLNTVVVNGNVDLVSGNASVSQSTLGGNLDVHANQATLSTSSLAGTLSGTGPVTMIGVSLPSGSHPYGGTISLGGNFNSWNQVNMPLASIVSEASFFGSGSLGAFTHHQDSLMPLGGTGLLNVGNLTIEHIGPFGNALVSAIIAGPTPGVSYGQVNVTGTVTIGLASLGISLDSNFRPDVGQEFVIIRNDGNDPINGTFGGAPEGAILTLQGGTQFRVSYVGGDGNDLSITCVLSPKRWTGATSIFWSDSNNWLGGAPQNGDALIFPSGASTLSTVNDLSGLSLSGLTFANGYTVSGSTLALTGPANGTSTVLFLSIDLQANNASLSSATVNGDIAIHASNVTLNTVVVNGNVDLVSGSASFFQTTFGGNLDVHANQATLHTSSLAGTLFGTGPVLMSAVSFPPGTHPYSGTITLFGNFNSWDQVNMPLASIVSEASFFASGSLGAFTQHENTLMPLGGTGLLNTGNLTIDRVNPIGNATLSAIIAGTTPGVSLGQVNVTGSVTIGLASLGISLNSNFRPDVGQEFVIIRNDGNDPINGTFGAAAEGTILTLQGGTQFRVSYIGGDGNDLSVTCVLSPKRWTGASSNLWSDPNNWLGGGTPKR